MKRTLSIHPFLFGIFPVLFLYSHNVNELPIKEIVAPLILVSVIVFLLWAVISLFIKDSRKAGIIVSFFSFLFFSFGSIQDFLNGFKIFGHDVGQSFYVFTLWATLSVIIIYAIKKIKFDTNTLTYLMNVTAFILVAIPTTSVIFSFIKQEHHIQTVSLKVKMPERRPDIYYIILDGYGRSDVLKKIYRYDNSDFLKHLSAKGFYIAAKSRSNYALTPLSLASSLNFVYLDDLVRQIGENSTNGRPLADMIHNNNLSRILKSLGYKFVVFSSGFAYTEIKNSDLYLSPRWSLSEFQNMLLNFTPLPVLLKILPAKSQCDLHRERILYILDSLANLTGKDSPKFVFTHIIAPHPPFVFGENGSPIEADERFVLGDVHSAMNPELRNKYIEGYRGQAVYISKKIQETLDAILSRSHEAPIIIIQSDHGPGAMLDWMNPQNTDFNERMSIFNAYHLPNNGNSKLYEEITPVNTFRIVLNHFFGTNLELLGDESYFPVDVCHYPYKFMNVTDKVSVK